MQLAKEQAARLRFGASRERARQVELDLRQTLSSALGNAKVALTSYKAGKEDTRIKKHIWHISEEGYRAGKLSSIDLILAQQEWFNSQQAQLKQIANLRYAVARMHLLMGQLAKDDL